MDLPPPPAFGTASGADLNAPSAISLDDVFSDIFFTPEGELMELPADDAGGVALGTRPLDASPSPPPVPMGGAAAAAGEEAAAVARPLSFGVVLPQAVQALTAPRPTASTGVGAAVSAGALSAAAAAAAGGSGGGGGGASAKPKFNPGTGAPTGIAALTEAQKAERREKNREHAKRSRVRKKFLLESLQRSVDTLENENATLKASIREYLGADGETLISRCSPAAEDDLVTSNPSRATRVLDDPDYSLVKALQLAQQNFVITDANLPDNPIVFASQGFLKLTGYTLDQILGRNCRFLQGPETDARAVDKIRNAIVRGEDTSVCLLNYRADGSTFWNQFFVAGLRDANGATVNYVGVQSKVSDEYARLVVQQQELEFAQGKAGGGSARRR